MSLLFKSYDKDGTLVGAVNTSRQMYPEKECEDYIFRGASISHVFTVPYKLEQIDDMIITYMQGTETKLVKEMKDMFVEQYGGGDYYFCKVSIEINEYESLNFNTYNQQVYSQIKILCSDGDIDYSPRYKVRVKANNAEEVMFNDN